MCALKTPSLITVGWLLSAAAAFPAVQHSVLWGERGEKWNPQSRLPDFSFAGYHSGEKALPTVPPGVSVKDFGAKGDGVTDDSQAFLDALDKVRSGAIEVPPGRYRITRTLEINRPNVVLRGAGPDKTILFFPMPLNDIKPNRGATTTGERTSNYSWSGGFVTLRGSLGMQTLANIASDAKRGDASVRVSSSERFRIGQRIEIFQSDTPDNSLAIHLYTGDSGPVQNLKGRTQSSLVCRVTRLEGDLVHFDRPLRCDVRVAWRPQLRSFEPTVTDSGIENLCFEFPNQPYRGHFTELGFNAIALGGGDHMVTDFDFRARYIHDITVSHHCSGNVCSRGRGVDLALDHHRYAPYENLFTDLDAGAGKRPWKCGGGADLGKHCGARGTIWNIRSASPLSYPPAGFGPPSNNLVALETARPSEMTPDGKWFEAIKPAEVQPRDLHAAQLRRRLDVQALDASERGP